MSGTTFGYFASVTKEEPATTNSYDEIDERLFDSYLDLSGRKNSTSLSDQSDKSASSDAASNSSYGENDHSGSESSSSIKGRHYNKSAKNYHAMKKRETKTYHQKKEEMDSDNDSIQSLKKSPKAMNKKASSNSGNNSSNSSVTSQELSEAEKKQKSLYKTELCRNWEETNHCRYGSKCQYAHGAADLREVDRHPKYKTQKCRTFHQTGSCPYGSRCTFRHFSLPGDALEMKNLEKEEAQKKQQQQQQQQEKEMGQQPFNHQKQQLGSFASTGSKQAVQRPSLFSSESQKLLQQNWYMDRKNHSRVSLAAGNGGLSPDQAFIPPNIMFSQTPLHTTMDLEDSLLPSNAESLLPHELLFNLDKPGEKEDPRVIAAPVTSTAPTSPSNNAAVGSRCPLRSYVNFPTFSSNNFHSPQFIPNTHSMHHPHQQAMFQPQAATTANNCKNLLYPWYI